MKKLLLVLIALLGISSANSQTFQLYDIDTTNFPAMKAKFFAFGPDGKQMRNFSISDFDLKEDGINRKVLSVKCPQIEEPKILSSVLTIDISGSMEGEGISNAKSAAAAWINAMPGDNSECAITSFSDDSYLVQDFTTDKSKLLQSISSLTTMRGTNYDAAFWQSPVSGLEVAKRGKYKRVMVFLSDGESEVQTQRIIDLANQYNVVVYCVTLNMAMPQFLKDISSKTGGLWFDNVISGSDAKAIYLKILNIAQNMTPCEIEWESQVQCPKFSTTLDATLNTISASSTNTYTLPQSAIAYLELKPSGFIMSGIPPGSAKDTTIIIKAINADFNISDITGNNPNFSISPASFSLKAGENKTLTITYTAIDSLLNFCTFDILNDRCKTSIYGRAGYLWQKSTNSTFRITHPNGGDKFGIGTDTLITWEGCAPDEKVKLEYSIDNGKTYRLITRNATGLKYAWKNIPNTPSNQCILRASLLQYDNINSSKILGLGTLRHAIFSPDGSKLASCGGGGIFIWDIASGDTILSIRGITGSVVSIAFSPDGSKIVSGSYDGSVKMWDVSTGAEIKTLSDDNSSGIVSYSHDGSKIASGSKDGSIKIWDANSGVLISTISGLSSANSSIEFSPDGSKIAGGNSDGVIKIWNVSSGVLLNTLTGHPFIVNSLSFSPDGNLLANASGGGNDKLIKIWDVNSGTLTKTLIGHTDLVTSVSFSPDGSKLASGSTDKTIKIWDVESWKEIRTLAGHISNVWSVKFSPDGNMLVSSSYDRTIKLWDANSGAVLKTLAGHTNDVKSISFSPDGSKIASGNVDATIKLWDLKSGDEIRTFSVYSNSTNEYKSVSFSPDGSKIASGSYQDADIWDSNLGTLIRTLSGPANSSYYSVSFNSDGSRLISGGTDSTIKLWDVNSGVLIKTLSGHKNAISSVSFSPDGNTIASGSHDNTIKIWSVNTTTEVKTLPSHNDWVNSVSFSPDGSKITSGSYDNTIKLWDAATGSQIWSITGHANGVNSVSFSPNGKSLASGGGDKKVKLWDTGTGNEIKTFTGHTDIVNCVSISPNGSTIASGSFDGTIRIWSIEEEPLLAQDVSDSVWSIIAPESIVKDIDMGKVPVETVKDSLVQSFIVNTGDFKVRIDSIAIKGQEADQFAVAYDIFPFSLNESQAKNVDFKFMPSSVGIKSADVYVYMAGKTIISKIIGEGFNLPKPIIAMTLRCGSAESKDGRRVIIPIYLINGDSLKYTDITSIDFELSFNASLLLPLDYLKQSKVVDGNRIIALSFPVEHYSNGILAYINMASALGNATETVLKLQNIKANGGEAIIDSVNGNFALLGVCPEGGDRLINIEGKIAINSIRPNPASSEVEVDLQLIESSGYNLFLVNSMGKLVKEISRNSSREGATTERIDLTDLSAGVYFIILQTESEKISQRLMIVK